MVQKKSDGVVTAVFVHNQNMELHEFWKSVDVPQTTKVTKIHVQHAFDHYTAALCLYEKGALSLCVYERELFVSW